MDILITFLAGVLVGEFIMMGVVAIRDRIMK